MGGATAIGLSKGKTFKPSDITVTAAHQATLDRFAAAGLETSLDNVSAVKGADIVVIVVKPWLVKEVVEQIRPVLDFKAQTIICMAAGISMEELRDQLYGVRNLFHIIPNTAIEVCQSMTFISPVVSDQEHLETVEGIFKEVGAVQVVDENHLEAGMALASCGLAYAFRYIRAAAEGGVELGLKAHVAAEVVAQTVKGAASLLEAHGAHPEEEIDKVTTPGGITIRGLNAMEEAGFTNAVIQGLKASVKRKG